MKIKIFGERNTGTNALTKILKDNSHSFIHPGTMAELDVQTLELTNNLKKIGASVAEIETLIDGTFEGRLIEEMWKHSATYPNADNIPSDTHFVFMVRHPISWFFSFYKNPYHCLIEQPKSQLGFYDCDWKTVGRDNLPQKFYKPVELYAEKLKSYRSFIDLLDEDKTRYTILNFEDMILDQKSCFDKLSNYLTIPALRFKELRKSTKNSKKDLNFYRQYYREEKWRDEIDATLLNSFEFDKVLLAWLNYKL